MRFVKREELKEGMRLAKPIYNKKGVLLYDRDSKLTHHGIESIHNFGLMGVYILDPAEPLPPMSEEDVEFEKFCTISEFSLMDELLCMKRMGKFIKLRYLADTYVSEFGKLDHPINFVQNIRGAEDYVYKHSSNVAILSALIANRLGLHYDEQFDAILASLVHDIGKLDIPNMILKKPELGPEDIEKMKKYELDGAEIIEKCFMSSPAVRRTMLQAYNHIDAFEKGEEPGKGKMVTTSKILIVADMFDRLTAMDLRKEPMSYIAAVRFLLSNVKWFDREVIRALTESINILNVGTSVELSNGESAVVLRNNPDDLFKPVILVLSGNTVIDLARSAMFRDLEVKDVTKTLDSRHVIDVNAYLN
ncbi:MAG: HD domain-containing protein [Lachnospiraceae bacterium]|nr:HD domain-containing protein [Lachnospiraceae bacterium]